MLIKDIRSTGSFPTNMERMPGSLAMLYGFSVAACLSSATSEEGGMGLGACVQVRWVPVACNAVPLKC